MVILITRATREATGYRFWNGSEDVTGELRFLMNTAEETTPEELETVKRAEVAPRSAGGNKTAGGLSDGNPHGVDC